MAIINKLTAIAEAIRSKTNTTEKLTLDEMPSAIEGIQSGGGVDWFQYATNLRSVYHNAVFDKEEVEISIPKVGNMYQAFYGVTGAKKIKINGNVDGKVVSCDGTFWTSNVEIIDLSDYYCTFGTMSTMFRQCPSLKCIYGEIDCSNTTSLSGTFMNDYLLEYVRFKQETISVSLDLGQSSKLTDETIQNIIDGLASIETSQTLKFHATVKAKLTEAQISQITSKNWTLA